MRPLTYGEIRSLDIRDTIEFLRNLDEDLPHWVENEIEYLLEDISEDQCDTLEKEKMEATACSNSY